MEEIGGKVLGAAVGGLLGGGSSSGGTQTSSKEPWAPAANWLQGLIGRGQELQNYYDTNLFNPAQKQALTNQGNISGYVQSQIPGLLNTVNSQGYFDRSNPSARPAQFQFGGVGSGASLPASSGGLIGSGGSNGINWAGMFAPGSSAPAPAAATPAPASSNLDYDTIRRFFAEDAAKHPYTFGSDN